MFGPHLSCVPTPCAHDISRRPMTTTSGPSQPTSTGLWRVRALGEGGDVVWTALIGSDRHADGADVELPEAQARAEAGGDTVGIARLRPDGQVTHIEMTTPKAPGSPPLWFAELPEPAATPPAVCLVAFSGHGVEPGRLLDRTALRRTGVRSADQLAAVRWYPGTGEVDQVYVAPDARRQGIGTAIILAAGVLTFPRGWARLWGDGQRTSEGESMRVTSVWSHRAAPLTHTAPPMTPSDGELAQ
jgi:GNAT superfamily N-acetyltransferase